MADNNTTFLAFGNAILDCGSKTLRGPKQSVHLSDTQFAVMRILLQSGQQLVEKESILENAWGPDSFATAKEVVQQIRCLRIKLENIGSNVSIKSVRCMGYYLDLEDRSNNSGKKIT